MCPEDIIRSISTETARLLVCEDCGQRSRKLVSCGTCKLLVCPNCWVAHAAHQEAE